MYFIYVIAHSEMADNDSRNVLEYSSYVNQLAMLLAIHITQATITYQRLLPLAWHCRAVVSLLTSKTRTIYMSLSVGLLSLVV